MEEIPFSVDDQLSNRHCCAMLWTSRRNYRATLFACFHALLVIHPRVIEPVAERSAKQFRTYVKFS